MDLPKNTGKKRPMAGLRQRRVPTNETASGGLRHHVQVRILRLAWGFSSLPGDPHDISTGQRSDSSASTHQIVLFPAARWLRRVVLCFASSPLRRRVTSQSTPTHSWPSARCGPVRERARTGFSESNVARVCKKTRPRRDAGVVFQIGSSFTREVREMNEWI